MKTQYSVWYAVTSVPVSYKNMTNFSMLSVFMLERGNYKSTFM